MSGGPVPASQVLARLMAEDRGRLLAALIAQLRDFQLAEDCLQEACHSALEHWQRSGAPRAPRGWILTAARRKAIDRIRRDKRFRDRQADLAILAAADEVDAAMPPHDIPDERLRLIFTCCHPALEPKSRVALTLRTLGGLTTAEIARAFLDSEPTMGQRLSRAKAKIAGAGIPYAVPGPEDWPDRLASVLSVIYLIFNEGYSATSGDAPIRVDLCDEAIWLARMLCDLSPHAAEPLGLLSLLLTTHARRGARGGELVPLDRQDRARWDRAIGAEGLAVLDRAMAMHQSGPYQIKAAISALHVAAPEWAATDFAQMRLLYSGLFQFEPTPVVALNRAVTLAETGALAAALAEVEALGADLDGYQPYHAARADLLSRLDLPGAGAAYDRAIALAGTPAVRRFLQARRDERLGPGRDG